MVSLLDLPIPFLRVKPTSQLIFTGFTTLPYIKDISDKIKRILLETDVQVAFKPFLTTGGLLPSLKDEINHNKKSSLVYEVPCQNCAFVYIEQTKRDFKSRIKEHQRAIKFPWPEKSALCQHSMENDQLIDWQRWSPRERPWLRGHIFKSLAWTSNPQVLGLKPSSPRKLPCPRLEDSTIFCTVQNARNLAENLRRHFCFLPLEIA